LRCEDYHNSNSSGDGTFCEFCDIIIIKMKGIFNLFRSNQSTKSQAFKEIALVCNFTNCQLGMNLHKVLSEHVETVGISHNGSQFGGLDKFLNL